MLTKTRNAVIPLKEKQTREVYILFWNFNNIIQIQDLFQKCVY